MLDAGSMLKATICNDKFVSDISEVDDPVQILTNGGPKMIQQQGTMEGFGKVLYDNELFANVFGFALMIDASYDILHNSKLRDEHGNKVNKFFVQDNRPHGNGKTVTFDRKGLT